MSTNKQRPVASFSEAEVQVLDAIRLGLPQRKDLTHLVRLPGFVRLSRSIKRMAEQLQAVEPKPAKVHNVDRVLGVLRTSTEPLRMRDVAERTGLTFVQASQAAARLVEKGQAQSRGRGDRARWTACIRLASVTQFSERKVAVR
jgi:hypothetical protein